MSPYQHGEVFVTDDGAETDLDLGHYERFIDINFPRTPMSQQVKYILLSLPRNVEANTLAEQFRLFRILPMKLKNVLFAPASEARSDVVITEIGGTVGDIESLPFLEAIRQMKSDIGRENVMYIHVTLIPYIKAAGEVKTKPTQHSVKELAASVFSRM